MRFNIAQKRIKIYPDDGAQRYRTRFAWRPVIAEGVAGEHGWSRHIIWLEWVIEEQHYGYFYGGWQHDAWMPRNEFSTKLR